MGKKSTIRSGFSGETVEEIACDLQSGSSVPVSSDKSDRVVLESCVTNIARNKKMSFRLLVTL